MSTQSITRKTRTIGGIITGLVLLFIGLSFVGVYLISQVQTEVLYVNLIKLALVMNMVFLVIYREFWKREINKYKRSNEYTFMVKRR